MRSHRHPPSRAVQALCLTLALAFVSAVFAQSVHSPDLEHAVCSDHGELIHVGAAGHDHAPAVTVLGESDTQDAEEEHEHCAIVTASRDTTVSDRTPTVTPLAEFGVGVVHPQLSTRDSGARYLIAPKNSPPRS